MQDKYTGDIGDYVKYALLRLIRKVEGGRLGVAWYLYPDEPNGHGGHLEYLDRPRDWERLDKELYWKLKAIIERAVRVREARRVASIEYDSGILGDNTKFFSKRLIPPQSIAKNTVANYLRREEWRREWFVDLQRKLVDCNVVFLDPDNGLYETEKFRYGTIKHWKRIPLSEVKALAKSGRTVVVYHHHTFFKGGNIHEINHWFKKFGVNVIAVRSAAWSPRSFFIVNPSIRLVKKIAEFVDTSQKLSIHTSHRVNTKNKATGIDNLVAEEAAQLYAPDTLRLEDTDVYRLRIRELCAYAKDDDFSLRPESEQDFWSFFYCGSRLRRFELVLIDNGNLRAVWRDEQETHLGLQFLGDNIVQFVIFKRRCPSQKISRVVGRDTLAGFEGQIQAFELQSLLYE